MPEAHVNGIRLCYEKHGDGTPILCIQGRVGSARATRPRLEGPVAKTPLAALWLATSG